MDSSSREWMQTDSEETQPPEVPREGFTPVQDSAPVQDSTPVQGAAPKRLDPSTEMWFGHRDVSHAIAENIQTHYKQAFTCWRYGPTDHKRFWWNCFKTQFTWDPQLDAEVKRQWQKLASTRLKDMVAKAAKEPMDKLITWMSDDIRRSLKCMRETDEDFKKRSERNRRNNERKIYS
uniref:Uncharacterized protein n=2 Tax=Opuntia streptacantha TaxID=393608 RepID=A0A7C9DCG1_OPUST